jgi:5'-3' exonuclease
MGIKNFRTNLTETFPEIITSQKPNNIHNLCIDFNGILHKICNRVKTRESFKKQLNNSLKKLIRIIKPKLIAIFIDGQAILAKANTQIKRRNKYLYSESSGINPLNLTAGSPFLEFIDETVNEFLSKLSNIETYYSSSKENNEGEIKLFEWLLKNNNNNNNNNRTCVLGSDSDLIILALASRPLIDIYIYDEKKYLSLFILIQKLSTFFTKKFDYKWHPVRLDFVLLSLFQGNDYNNKIADFKKLLKSYQKTQFLINKKGELNLINIKKLFLNISTTYPITCQSIDVEEYFKAIRWNLNLYQGRLNTKFIPNYSNININSIIKFMPKKINLIEENTNWLHPDVYILMLMPSTGKDYLPNHLKHLLEVGSPIKDLFPEPCIQCIQWKKELKDLQLIKPDDNASLDELNNYKKLVSKTSVNYSNHIKSLHNNTELPIMRLEKAIESIE